MDIIRLAVLCQKAAEDASMDDETAAKARKLKQEWALLVARETPLAPDLRTHEQIQAEKAALKARMVDLLAAI